MIELDSVYGAFTLLSSDGNAWLYLLPGLLIGLVFGAMPGISITMAMAFALPATLYMDFLPAIIFLTAIYTGAGFGGSVPAVLMGIPGTSSAVATTFDGYPMARKGLHSEALGIALASSVIGCLASYAMLFVLIVPISGVVLKLGPLEMFAVAVWGMLLLGSLAGAHISRGILAGTFGVLLGTIGMNTAGFVRGTVGIPWLLDGVPQIPAMMGLLAASQLIGLINTTYLIEDESSRKISFAKILGGVRQCFRYPTIIFRGSLIGVIIGAIPGVGSSISNLLSYSETKRNAPDGDTFGEGNPKGVIAAEAANSSSEGGAMATMLALGIPGGGATAILLAAFAMHNIVGGPSFIAHNKDIVYAIMFSNFAQAILLFFVGLGFVYVAGYVVRVPLRFLIPSVLVVSTFGAYAIEGSSAGPITLWVFSVLGWGMVRYGYPVAAAVVGLLLGGLLEGNLLRTNQISGGDFIGYGLERPWALVIFALMIGSILLQIVSKRRRAKEAFLSTGSSS
ncbi:MAG: tripartite tricarboxylate transporter permease [Hoeflea sp.]|uniref:tripartite tricarboxylate transporter permease n=1 Tax=Hoeflea sp. TaxID=1940281 RepID=UPI001D2188F8|nr:tripartite tricarboxylate transporter permease [Hoeflea sp.]MBU4530337.1 tripartite tricarboxylate transporter permease [Alphaproteobacteria bacterium]MBU4545124.1 tripartite tricarboxylate transporter permease [Alphaproteobacteria bacterium]MBU4549676.1 tripartite tricarboxylate transporter permease [Alphaproteobacteria bacterium]MBV1721927.1 tripartite tricarboxylate transporter permease [Hoeflea sp.]MBV1761277.1 tripartite tricarboxylate transporter permease [Hoeflea sp.]